MELVTLAEISEARERIRATARYTPLIESPWPRLRPGSGAAAYARAAGHQDLKPSLFLKCENLQPMGAFKIRGAFNMISQLPKENLERGVITYSSGNHGQAVAKHAGLVSSPAPCSPSTDTGSTDSS